MAKKYLVYAKGHEKENDITIECHDEEDMNDYAQACREQGYKEVVAVVEEGDDVDSNT